MAAQAAPAAAVAADEDPIARIRDEGLNRSEVMTTLGHLTDVIGPRLTGSPGLRRASDWTRDKLSAWGLSDARHEPWGPFGRGWELKRFSAQLIAPQAYPLIALPRAWSPGVGATTLEADVVAVNIRKPDDFAEWKGKLRGKIVLDGDVVPIKLGEEPSLVRHNDSALLRLANAPDGRPISLRPPTTNTPLANPEQRAALALTPQRYRFFAEEGVAAVLTASTLRHHGGTLFTGAAHVYPPAATPEPAPPQKGPRTATPRPTPWKPESPPILPQVSVSAEQYNRLVRMIAQGESLRIALELQAVYHPAEIEPVNVLAEIPGTDLAHEIVMLGAHLDSWHAGTGATDNGSGCAVVMEAVRILRALQVTPRRTIRIALWSGEEQGLLGSRAYVFRHFGSPTRGQIPPSGAESSSAQSRAAADFVRHPAHDHLSAYFNLDNGSGRIRGIHLQGNQAVRPIFAQWLKPFADLGAQTLSLGSVSQTDHVAFDEAGLPGFQFIQDPLEYETRTHHTNMDLLDRTSAEDLKQASVIMAAFVYQAAQADTKLPRKPMPGAGSSPAAEAPAATTD